MKKLMVLALVVLMVLAQAPGAYAIGKELNPEMKNVYTRGFKNALTFWVEVPKTIYHEGKAEPGKGHLRGVFLGPMKGMERLLSGLWDIATAPCPDVNRLAVDPETLF